MHIWWWAGNNLRDGEGLAPRSEAGDGLGDAAAGHGTTKREEGETGGGADASSGKAHCSGGRGWLDEQLGCDSTQQHSRHHYHTHTHAASLAPPPLTRRRRAGRLGRVLRRRCKPTTHRREVGMHVSTSGAAKKLKIDLVVGAKPASNLRDGLGLVAKVRGLGLGCESQWVKWGSTWNARQTTAVQRHGGGAKQNTRRPQHEAASTHAWRG
jgi:hypothetical protein